MNRFRPALLVVLTALTACAPAATTGRYRPAGSDKAVMASHPPVMQPGELAVVAAYRHFNAVVESVLADDDPRPIRTVATGPEAVHLEQSVHAQMRQGVIRRGHSALSPQAAVLPDGRAIVVDCVVSTGLWSYDRRTGRPVGQPPSPLRTAFRAMLVRDGRVWKVSDTSIPDDPRC